MHLWTDISAGALYGALKRMEGDELIEVVRVEREGNYPERQVYGVTEAGRTAMQTIRDDIFDDVAVRADPFDLAFTRLDPERIDDLAERLERRRDAYRAMLEHEREHLDTIVQHLWTAERLSIRHRILRLEAEVAWHDEVLALAPEIAADEQERRRHRGQKPSDASREAARRTL